MDFFGFIDTSFFLKKKRLWLKLGDIFSETGNKGFRIHMKTIQLEKIDFYLKEKL